MQINPDNVHFISGSQPSDNFTLAATETPLATGGSAGTVLSRDITFNVNTGSGVTNNFILTTIDPMVSYSVDPATNSAATITPQGVATMTGGGICNFIATKQGFGSKTYTRNMANTAGTAYTGVNGYTNGSLIKYLHDQMVSICNAAGGSSAANQYQPNVATTTSANATLMLNKTGVAGFTPFDPSIMSGNTAPYPTAIPTGTVFLSPYHFISALGSIHNSYKNMGNAAFDGDGTYPNEIWLDADIRVGHLLSPLYPVASNLVSTLLPANYASYLPNHYDATWPMNGFPCWARLTHTYLPDEGTNPQSQMWVQPVQCNIMNILPPIDAALLPYCKTYSSNPAQIISGGDSGSKLFTGINGTPILLGHVYGKINNPNYQGYIEFYAGNLQAQIQSAMNSLSTIYGTTPQTIQTINLATAGFSTV